MVIPFSVFNEDLTLQYHNILNQKLFDGDYLKPDVRAAMLKVANLWIQYCNITDAKIDDIIFTGGNASFNYVDNYSDVDIHVVTDTSKIIDNKIFLDDYFYDKKMMFAIKYGFTIKGYPVEMYVQDINDKLVASAIYSLQDNDWVKKPTNLNLDITHNIEIEQKRDYYEDLVKKAIHNNVDIDRILDIKKQIVSLRKNGLANGNEFDPGNLLFKELRNKKVLDLIDSYVKMKQDKEYSLQ